MLNLCLLVSLLQMKDAIYLIKNKFKFVFCVTCNTF